MEALAGRLSDIGNRCPGCGSSPDFKPLFPISEENDVFFFECTHCGIGTANKLPKDDLVLELYEPKNYVSSLTNETSLSKRCAERILPHISVFDPTGDFRILDYGGGNGNLSKQLIEMLSENYPDLRLTSAVVDLYQRNDDGPISFVTADEFLQSSDTYDLVIASAILEHLVDVKTVMDRLIECGNPRAIFYARTPYEVPISRIIGRSIIRWPRHLHDMGPAYWSHLEEVYDGRFRIVKSRTSLVETSFATRPVRTFIAYVMKAPSHLESFFRGNANKFFWKLVGGWEVIAVLNETT